MVVKAARANVGILAGFRHLLAITLAEQSHIGLVGFRPHRHVVYAGQSRFTEEANNP